MRAIRKFSLALAATAILLLLAIVLTSLGANSRFTQSSAPKPSAKAAVAQTMKTYTMYSGLWRTDGGFVSTIRVKNVLVVAPMDITPVLFMADGTVYPLPSVHLAVSGVATININDALANAPSSVISHISQFGSAALIHSYSSPGHVAAMTEMMDTSRSLSHSFPFAELMGTAEQQTIEGLWWKHDPGVTGFIALSNATDTTMQAAVQLVSPGNDAEPPHTVSLEGHQTRMFRLEDFAADPSMLAMQAGGIRVRYTGQPESIQVTGGLENDAEGYSANIPFGMHDMSASPATGMSYGSAGLLVGKPDPAVMPGFPKETTFAPYLVLGNTTEKPIEVAVQLNYSTGRAGEAPVTRNLPNHRLRPSEARQVDLRSMLNAAGLRNFNGTINLSTSFSGHAGDLLVATGSVDQTGTYVFEVTPQGIGESRMKFVSYWGLTDGNDTMFSLWNPTIAPQDIEATFLYGDGSGKYVLPVHLEAQTSTIIDMGVLIAQHLPDRDGNLVPTNVREGSVQFASAKGNTASMTLVIAAGTYNVQLAICCPNCVSCCGYSNFYVTGNGFLLVGGSTGCDVFGVDCTGTSINLDSDVTSWSNNGSSAASVSSSGVVTAVSPGTATITAHLGFEVTYQGLYCCPILPMCPGNNASASISITVAPALNSISPARGPVGSTITVTLNGNGFGSNCTNITINAGSGITPNCNSVNNTQIQASFAISASAGGGNRSVNVTINSQTSPIQNFYVQIPTYFVATGASSVLNTYCAANQAFYAEVNYQLADQVTNPILAGGFTPRESVSSNGSQFSPFHTFATPPSTNSDGTFEDNPVGTCFSVPPPPNRCVTVLQNFQILVPGASAPFPISTTTSRTDCEEGIKITVSPGSTYTFGILN